MSFRAKLLDWTHEKERELTELPGRAWRAFQVALLSIREFRRALCLERAANLSYVTIMSLIPLAVLFFSFAGLLGGGDRIISQVEDKIFPLVAPEFHDQLAGWLNDNISTSAFKGGPTGVVNVVAIVLLLLSALGLLTSSERYFNVIWRVSRNRTFLQRATAFWLILTTSPFLIAISISFGDFLVPEGGWIERQMEAYWIVKTIYSIFVPLMISFLGFTLVYLFLPATKVSMMSGALGGFCSAVLWGLTKQGFFFYVSRESEVRSFYGQLATIPLFLVWVFLSWVIILGGTVIAYTHQNLDGLLRMRRLQLGQRRFSRFFVGCDVLISCYDAFRGGKPLPSVHDLASRLAIPVELVTEVGDVLVEAGYLIEDAQRSSRYTLQRDASHIVLADLARVLLTKDFSGDMEITKAAAAGHESAEPTSRVVAHAWGGLLDALGERTLADELESTSLPRRDAASAG